MAQPLIFSADCFNCAGVRPQPRATAIPPQVLAGDGFGDGMLNLQPRVHFHEPDTVGLQAFGRIGELNSAVPAPT